MSRSLLSIFLFLSFSISAFATEQSNTYERYFLDTYACLEKMRNSFSGLVVDSMKSDGTVLNDDTSPSNIGLDLLVQLEASVKPSLRYRALQNINRTLRVLERIPYHRGTGLFYNRYSSDGILVKEYYVSSVDNIHLAYALWVLRESLDWRELRDRANRLFTRLNFHPLFNESNGVFAGGLYLHRGSWNREAWGYDYFGSEGRSLYAIGYALGLIPKIHMAKSRANLRTEFNGKIIRLWDGGAFQLLLPRLLIHEDFYSRTLRRSFVTYADYIIEEGKKRELPVPAAHSASQVDINAYNGKAGSIGLVASLNGDIKDPVKREAWDRVFTPHAAFLAAPLRAQDYENIFLLSEKLGTKAPLYLPGLGWHDGLHVSGERSGEVVPVFLSLDQAMIMLSLSQILSPDGMTMAARVLGANRQRRELLFQFYR